MDAVRARFIANLEPLGIALGPDQAEAFEAYFRLLTEWNRKMNLTAITERASVYEKHFYDSLTVAAVAPLAGSPRLVDVGSGAGFPAIPLKIAFPGLRVTMVDSLAKRVRFLEEAVRELGLSDVVCLHARAEDAARLPGHRDGYDVATARAVARLSVLNELCLPFVRPGGLFVAMKGSDVAEEIEEGRYGASLLGARLREVRRMMLPEEGAVRHLVVWEKTGPTPARFPRRAGEPARSPLLPDGKKPHTPRR
ncbi:MAG TPA: 16S rRNA (guanine(527)-N(7))-methyltransferase RsmG [Paenibacillaceae bacterium]